MVIADLHLNPEGGPGVRAFGSWLDGLEAPALIILGDLFDSWIGPKQRRLAGSAEIIESLRELVRRGTELHVVPGNRDFLLGADLEAWTGGQVHPAGLTCGGQGSSTSLLIHGDELCTKDLGYQNYKQRIQSPWARRWLPRLPLFVLRRIARKLRAASERSVPRKGDDEKSMQLAAAQVEAQREQAQVLVCGHAHRFQDERFGDLRWFVLDAWGGELDSLLWEPGGWRACGHGEHLAGSVGE